MLLVETNLDVALRVASRVYVMEKGQIKFNGSKEELVKSIDIQQSYLGVSF
jgi:branched-chain amino acid transport system ATP-binding protein